jgi:toxin-antitoxin system PIN domain toxin
MKLPDANLLIYAFDEPSPYHDEAHAWIETLLSGTETVGFAWTVLLAFLRITTRPQLVTNPLKPEAALSIIDGWLGQPVAIIIHPTERHLDILRGLLESSGTAGNLTTDAHLAALAMEHGGEVCSADTDFARFPGLRWTNPLK